MFVCEQVVAALRKTDKLGNLVYSGGHFWSRMLKDGVLGPDGIEGGSGYKNLPQIDRNAREKAKATNGSYQDRPLVMYYKVSLSRALRLSLALSLAQGHAYVSRPVSRSGSERERCSGRECRAQPEMI